MAFGPLVRVEDAGLGPDAQVRLVVSGVSRVDRLRAAWASSGAALESDGARLRATTTVEALARAAGRTLEGDEAAALDRSLRTAVTAWRGPVPAWELPGARLETNRRPHVMAVLNVTPDSFSDGGVLYPTGHPAVAIERADALVAEGADVLDIGGESTRPGSSSVPVEEELRRVVPVLEALTNRPTARSIDTVKPAVARAAIGAGAAIVNDVSGGRDPGLLEVVAETGAAYVLMHTRGTPADMSRRARYDDVVAEVYEFLAAGLARCAAAGIAAARVAVDPGIGFAKTPAHNITLLRSLRQLRGLGRPVVVGASRKSFLGALLGGVGTDDRLEGSLACVAAAVTAGVSVVRVHDVASSVRVATVVHAVTTGGGAWPPVSVGDGARPTG